MDQIQQATSPARWEDCLATVAGSTLSSVGKSHLTWLIRHALETGQTRTVLAGEIGVALTTLSRILDGTYNASASNTIDKVAMYRTLVEARAVGGDCPEFIYTIQSNRIWQACDTARRENVIVPIIGKTQIGKTKALEEYARQNAMVVYLLAPVPCTQSSLMRRMARALGVDDRGLKYDITTRIQKKLTRNHLVIIDEIHQATRRTKEKASDILEWIRLEIYDHAKCGVILAATPEFEESFRSGPLSGMLDQIAERSCGYKVVLPTAPTKQDVAAIWTHYGLSAPDADSNAIITLLARDHGMRALTGIFRTASRDAGLAREIMEWRHFVAAYNRASEKL